MSLSLFIEDEFDDDDGCPERWADEVGCDDGSSWHYCPSRAGHGPKHECHCGAYVLEVTP